MNITLSSGILSLLQKSITAKIHRGEKIVVGSDSEKNIDWPGEYEISGVSARVFSAQNNELIFIVSFDGIRLLIPSSSFVSMEENLQEIGSVDVMSVFADSSEWSVKEWKKFLEEVDSRIVIFCENGEKTASLLKELGISDSEKLEKLEVSVKNLPADKTRYVSLIAE